MAVSVLFLLHACAQQEGKKGPYLAKVGKATITQADYERELKSLPEFAQQLFEGAEGKERFLDELIKKELLYQEAQQKGLDKDEEFTQKIEEFKKITLIGYLLEKEVEEQAELTDQEVKDYYEQHKEDFANITQMRASHILVKTEDEAKLVLERIKKGESFAKVAREKSIDPGSARNGGDLGYFSSGQMVPEFEAAAARMKKGEISPPVKTKFGYHIIQVTDKKVGKTIEFDKVKTLIYQRLSADKQKDIFDSYIAKLRNSYKVDVNQEALSKMFGGEEKSEQADEKQQEDTETPLKESPEAEKQ
jgi:peptidyl-prolyl cis-trans isomerase C